MVRRPDNVLLLAYKDASAHDVNDGALHLMFSDDDGTTWTDPDTALDAGAVSGFPMNPTVSAGQDAGEPLLMEAPNGDLLLHMWRIDYSVSQGGTWQSKSTDGGETWSVPTQIDFAGIGSDNNIFSTDDWFVFDGVIYAAARVHSDTGPSTSKNILISSDDNGATWTWVSDITTTTDNTIECGLEYVGDDTIVAVLRTTNNTFALLTRSTDMGATWSVPIRDGYVTTSGRHRIHTKAHLQGGANWWLDPKLIMVGFVLGQNGNSQQRTNAIWLSDDAGVSWSGPYRLDGETEDAGYGDVFYDADNDQWVVVTYHGTLAAAAIKQYRLSIGNW